MKKKIFDSKYWRNNLVELGSSLSKFLTNLHLFRDRFFRSMSSTLFYFAVAVGHDNHAPFRSVEDIL
jgi:hypothetical protein